MVDTNDLEKATKDAEELAKAHVKQYQRKTKSGGVTTVKEHDDSRQKKAGGLPGHWRDAHDHAVNLSEQAWNGQAEHKDAVAALKHSAKLHMDAESAADRDGDDKAAEHHGDKARDQLTRAKQHLEEVKRGGKPRAASGAADKLMAAAEKHQADMDWGNPDTAGAAKKYSAAAIAHIQAMEEAAGAKDSESQRHHYYKATTALSHAHSMSTFQKGNEEATAKQATSLAKHISGIANKQRGEDNGHDLDHGSALHLLAAEQHGRAAEAHMAMANKQADSKTLSKEHTKLAEAHRNQQIAHGKEVQRLAGISIRATEAARAAGKAAKSPEQHKLASEAHKHAAALTWDRESKAEHEKMAGYHNEQAKMAGKVGRPTHKKTQAPDETVVPEEHKRFPAAYRRGWAAGTEGRKAGKEPNEGLWGGDDASAKKAQEAYDAGHAEASKRVAAFHAAFDKQKKEVDQRKMKKRGQPYSAAQKSLPDDLDEAADAVEQLTKAHVKEYQRRTKSGGVATVKEHDDKRMTRDQAIKEFRQGYARAGIDHKNKGEYVTHYSHGRDAGMEDDHGANPNEMWQRHIEKRGIMDSVEGKGQYLDGYHASLHERDNANPHYNAGYATGQAHAKTGKHKVGARTGKPTPRSTSAATATPTKSSRPWSPA